MHCSLDQLLRVYLVVVLNSHLLTFNKTPARMSDVATMHVVRMEHVTVRVAMKAIPPMNVVRL